MRSNSMCPNRMINNKKNSNYSYLKLGSVGNIHGSESMNSINKIPLKTKYSYIKSQVNSLTDYKPTPSKVQIFHQPLKVNAKSKICSLENANHIPKGGDVKIENHKIIFKEKAKPKIDAKLTIEILPSNKKIPNQKLNWKAESKVGSLVNANHKPTGGNVKIFHQSVKLNNVQSKISSLENANHVPGGGNVNIHEYNVRGASRFVDQKNLNNNNRSLLSMNKFYK